MPRDSLADESDEALLALYAKGDHLASRSLTARLAPRLLTFATRLLSDRAEAEDVTQETMLRLWRIAPKWRSGEAQVVTWAYRVAGNLCTDRMRSGRRRPTTNLEAAPDVAAREPGALAVLIEIDRTAALQMALAQLPERQRQAVVLRHLDGLPNPEIALILDIGVEAVESLTARGKRNLTALLAGRRADLGYDDEGER